MASRSEVNRSEGQVDASEHKKQFEDTKEGRITYFIKVFVQFYEQKSREKATIACVGGGTKEGTVCSKIPKSIAGPSSALTTSLGLPPVIGPIVGTTYSLVRDPLVQRIRKSHRMKAKKLTCINVEYDQPTLRTILAETAAHIFYSFQTQLVDIYDQDGFWWRGLDKFAIDARDRILNYLPQEYASHSEISCKILENALLQGDSKQSFLSRLAFKKAGHAIKLKNMLKKKTESLLDSTGIKRDDGNGGFTYYIKKDSKREHATSERKHRLLFEWEEESDWETLYKKTANVRDAGAAKMLFRKDDLQQYIDDALEHIYREDPLSQLQNRPSIGEEGNLCLLQRSLREELPREIFEFPPPVPNFEGRDKDLRELHRLLQIEKKDERITKCATVTGLGGIGKTQLARKYAEKYKDSYDGRVVWLVFENGESLRQSLVKVANALGILTKKGGRGKGSSWIARTIFDYFSTVKCLYVFDNVEEFENIKDFLPEYPASYTVRPTILITSRNSNWYTGQRGKIEMMRLDVFSKEEALHFVKKELEVDEDSLDELINTLAEKLSYFPLALRQAVSYMKPDADPMSVHKVEQELQEYIKSWDGNSRTLLQQKSKLDDYEKNVYITWKITISSIEKKNGDLGLLPIKLLEMLAYLPPDSCKISYFVGKETLKFLRATEGDLRKAFKLLNRYSLISIINEDELSIHRLVQEIIRLWLKESMREEAVFQDILQLELNCPFAFFFLTEQLWVDISNYTQLINDFILKKGNTIPYIVLAYAGNVPVLTELLKKSKKSRNIKEIFRKTLKFVEFDAMLITKDQDMKKFVSNFLLIHAHVGQALKKGSSEEFQEFIAKLPKGADKKLFLNSKFMAPVGMHTLDTYHLATPIDRAVMGGDNFSLVKFLIENEAVITSDHVLMAAAKSGRSILKLLVRTKEDCEVTDTCGRTPLHLAAGNGNLEAATFLLEMEVDTDVCDQKQRKPVEYAIERGKTEVVKLFFNRNKLDVNERFVDSIYPLMLAVCSTVDDLVLYLLKKGAKKDCETDTGIRMIHFAAGTSTSKILQIFGDSKQECERKTFEQWSPLHFATYFGNLEAVNFLFETEVDPRPCDKDGHKPIEYALIAANIEIVAFFLAKNWMEINETFEDKCYALHYAVRSCNVDLVRFLIEKGADNNCETNFGKKPIHFAAEMCNADILELFAENTAVCEEQDYSGATPLHYAAAFGNLEAVKVLFNKKVNPNLCDSKGWKPVEYALAKGHIEIVQFFLCKNWMGANEMFEDTCYPLHRAILSDNIDLVRYLINKGADVSCKTNRREKPIHLAAEKCNSQMLELFVESEGTFQDQDHDGWTPLHHATLFGNLDAVKFLLKNNVDPHICDENGVEPIEYALQSGHMELIKFFLSNNLMTVNQKFGDTLYPLHWALFSENIALMRFLIEKGADKDCKLLPEKKLIHLAAALCNSKILKLLGENREVCECRGDNGWTPLHYAAYSGNLEAVKFLFKMNVNPHVCDNEGYTPVEYALSETHVEIVEFFLSCKWMNVNQIFGDKYIPLHFAILADSIDLVRYLLDKGADKNWKTSRGEKAIHFAAKKCNSDMLELLDVKKEECEEKDCSGWTPLHYATAFGNFEAVKFLFKMNVDPHICDDDGCKPVEYALVGGHMDIVKFFLLNNWMNVNEKFKNLKFPLDLAESCENVEMTKFLQDNGAFQKCSIVTGENISILN